MLLRNYGARLSLLTLRKKLKLKIKAFTRGKKLCVYNRCCPEIRVKVRRFNLASYSDLDIQTIST